MSIEVDKAYDEGRGVGYDKGYDDAEEVARAFMDEARSIPDVIHRWHDETHAGIWWQCEIRPCADLSRDVREGPVTW